MRVDDFIAVRNITPRWLETMKPHWRIRVSINKFNCIESFKVVRYMTDYECKKLAREMHDHYYAKDFTYDKLTTVSDDDPMTDADFDKVVEFMTEFDKSEERIIEREKNEYWR